MKQDRKPRNKPMHLWVSYIWQRRQEDTMGQRWPLMVLAKLDQFSSVQLVSRVPLFVTINCSTPGLPVHNSRSYPNSCIESVMPSIHLILCCPLLLLPPILPSIRVFSNESTLHTRWPKYWSFSFSISPSNEHPGLISFRMDW